MSLLKLALLHLLLDVLLFRGRSWRVTSRTGPAEVMVLALLRSNPLRSTATAFEVVVAAFIGADEANGRGQHLGMHAPGRCTPQGQAGNGTPGCGPAEAMLALLVKIVRKMQTAMTMRFMMRFLSLPCGRSRGTCPRGLVP
jgi:hypothetical protein